MALPALPALGPHLLCVPVSPVSAPWSPGSSFLPLHCPGSCALSHLHGASLFHQELSQRAYTPEPFLQSGPGARQGHAVQ